MVCVKNDKIMSKFVKVMQRKLGFFCTWCILMVALALHDLLSQSDVNVYDVNEINEICVIIILFCLYSVSTIPRNLLSETGQT